MKPLACWLCTLWFNTTGLFRPQQDVCGTKTPECCKQNDTMSVRKSAVSCHNLRVHGAQAAYTNVEAFLVSISYKLCALSEIPTIAGKNIPNTFILWSLMNVYNAVCFLYNTQALRKLNRSRGCVKDHRWAPWLPWSSQIWLLHGNHQPGVFHRSLLVWSYKLSNMLFSSTVTHTHTNRGCKRHSRRLWKTWWKASRQSENSRQQKLYMRSEVTL